MKSLCVAGCALALAASPAGAFKPTLRLSLGKSSVYGASVDRAGDIFVTEFLRNPFEAFDGIASDKVVRFAPHGKRLNTIEGAFRQNSDFWFMSADATVTPNGKTVIQAGAATTDGTDPHPLVTEYAAATGRFLRGAALDTDPNDWLAQPAVDPTGQHVYLVDIAGAPLSLPLARIVELNVSDLSVVRRFPLTLTAPLFSFNVDAIAVGGPDGDVYVSLDPPSGHGLATLQVYKPDGTFIRQFKVARQAGIAVNARGQVFTGGPRGFDVHNPDGSTREPGIAAPGVTAVGVDGSDHLYGLEVVKGRAAIVKFSPQVPPTKIVVADFNASSPNVTFKLRSSAAGSTFECRLERRGFDAVPFAPCSSPKTYSGLPNGLYRLDARAISLDGAADPTPASSWFKIAVSYAHARITAHPAKLIGKTTATFKFTSATPNATFKCRLTPLFQVPKAFKACASPMSYHALTHSAYSFQVEAVTSAGLVEAAGDSFQFAVDPDPPAVTAPAFTVAPGQQTGPLGGLYNVTFGWSASDPNTPSAQLVDTLDMRSAPTGDPLGPWTPVGGADHLAGHTAATLPISVGWAYRFRAEAQNALGVVGTSVATSAQLAVVDDSDPAIGYSGDWTPAVKNSEAIGGSAARATTAGAKATVKLTGRSIGVVGVPGPGRGVVRVCVDSKCASVDTNAATKTERELIFTRNGLSDTAHTVTLEATSAPVTIDGFVALH